MSETKIHTPQKSNVYVQDRRKHIKTPLDSVMQDLLIRAPAVYVEDSRGIKR
jgi:hypothetical protein